MKAKKKNAKKTVKSNKLSPDKVWHIRELRAIGSSLKELALLYKVSIQMINYVVTGQRYANVGGPLTRTNRSCNAPTLDVVVDML